MKMTDLSILPKMDLGKKYERITAYENKCAIGIIAGDIIGDTYLPFNFDYKYFTSRHL